MKLKFSGRRALVLAGSCELGLCLARKLIQVEIIPLLTFRSAPGKARIQERFNTCQGKYELVALNLCSVDSMAALAPALDSGVDYLVDFAQGNLEGLVASIDSAAASRYFQENIAARVEVIRQVARKMTAQRKGRMVYVSSAAAVRPQTGQGFYAASKQASEALYRNVGLELASRGVTTAILRPGYVNVGRGRRYLDKEAGTALAKVPLGRALNPEEVAETVMFLLSDSATGINASVVTMDGGLSSCK